MKEVVWQDVLEHVPKQNQKRVMLVNSGQYQGTTDRQDPQFIRVAAMRCGNILFVFRESPTSVLCVAGVAAVGPVIR